MENVMNFLADNYIWFFVAAGVLFFALIGFIIESRKKQKNEFKGESIEETKTEETPVTPVTPVENATTPEEQSIEENTKTTNNSETVVENTTPTPVEPIMPINNVENTPNTLNNEQPAISTPLNSAIEESENKETIETPASSGIEYYNGPIEMPINAPIPEPMPEPIESISEPQVVNNFESSITNETIEPTRIQPTPIVTPIENNQVNYEQITPNETTTNNNFNTEENKETNDYNIFDNMN